MKVSWDRLTLREGMDVYVEDGGAAGSEPQARLLASLADRCLQRRLSRLAMSPWLQPQIELRMMHEKNLPEPLIDDKGRSRHVAFEAGTKKNIFMLG